MGRHHRHHNKKNKNQKSGGDETNTVDNETGEQVQTASSSSAPATKKRKRTPVSQDSIIEAAPNVPSNHQQNNNSNQDNDDNDDEENDEVEDAPLSLLPDKENDEELMVDFEVKQVQDDDFWGVQLHVQHLLHGQPFNAVQLADLIVKEKDLTSVVKVSNSPPDADDDANDNNKDDDDDDDSDDRSHSNRETASSTSIVAATTTTATSTTTTTTTDPFAVFSEIFAVISVIGYRNHKDEQWLNQLTEYITKNCQDAGKATQLRAFLTDDASSLGVLINERVLNLPPQLAPPLNINLFKEISTVSKSRKDVRFENFLIVTKVYRESGKPIKQGKKKSKVEQQNPLLYFKIEEEFYHKHATLSYTFPIKDVRAENVDPAITQEKLVMVVSRQNIPKIIEDMKQALGNMVDLE